MWVGAVRKDQILTTSRPDEREEVAEKELTGAVGAKQKNLVRRMKGGVRGGVRGEVRVAAVVVVTPGAVVVDGGGAQEINTRHISKQKQLHLRESREARPRETHRAPLRSHGEVWSTFEKLRVMHSDPCRRWIKMMPTRLVFIF